MPEVVIARTAAPAAAALLAILLAACASPPPAEPRPLPPKRLPVAGERFWVGEHAAFAIAPQRATDAGERPSVRWVLYAPTLAPYPDDNEVWLIDRLLASGIGVAGIDVGESYGNAAGAAAFAALCEAMTARGWSPTPVLLARSRGGLQQLAFAAAHPQRVAAIACIYPVFDLRSYPGLDKAAGAYGTDAAGLEAALAEHNPIERIAPIAAAGVPIFAIHGDADQLVPLEANSAALAARYRALGGKIELEIAKGQGHSAWPGFFRSERLLRFVLLHAR